MHGSISLHSFSTPTTAPRNERRTFGPLFREFFPLAVDYYARLLALKSSLQLFVHRAAAGDMKPQLLRDAIVAAALEMYVVAFNADNPMAPLRRNTRNVSISTH